ncbi:MAG: protease modulator HflK, partial [Methylobacter sp.]
VTRKRLYIEAMESVLSETNTIMVDVKGSNNMLYLPLDKMIQQPSMQQTSVPQGTADQPHQEGAQAQPQLQPQPQPAARALTRGRDARGR